MSEGRTALGLGMAAALAAIRVTLDDLSAAEGRVAGVLLVLPSYEGYHVGDHALESVEALSNAIHLILSLN